MVEVLVFLGVLFFFWKGVFLKGCFDNCCFIFLVFLVFLRGWVRFFGLRVVWVLEDSIVGVVVFVFLGGVLCFGKVVFLEDCSLGDCCFSFFNIFGFVIILVLIVGWLLFWSLEEVLVFVIEDRVDNFEFVFLEILFCFRKVVFLGCSCCFVFIVILVFLVGWLLFLGLGVIWVFRLGKFIFVGVDVVEFFGIKIK